MNITHEEWLEVRNSIWYGLLRPVDENPDSLADALTEAALGCPCPPEPAPSDWRPDAPHNIVVRQDKEVVAGEGRVWVGFPFVAYETFTPREAFAMAEALVEHAEYLIDCEQDAHEEIAQDPAWTVALVRNFQVGDQVLYYGGRALEDISRATILHIVDAPDGDTVKIRYESTSGYPQVRWVNPNTLEKVFK
jgi:hypothetical protein